MEEIKASDIMLNNWFQVNGFPMYVDSIFRDTVYLEFEGNEGDVWEENVKDLSPIPLTEDVLLKCGFVRMSEKLNFYILGYDVNLKIDKKIKWVAWCNSVLTNVEITYLHELQNLVKCLTKTELIVEL